MMAFLFSNIWKDDIKEMLYYGNKYIKNKN